MPVGVGQRAGGREDGDGAAFVAVAARVVAVGRPERWRGGGDLLAVLVQGRPVALNLDDPGDAGRCGEFEMPFWQCRAASVTKVSRATPSSAKSVCAAGISLAFSAMST
ncbi:MAG: hypothetical protein ACJ8H8_09005 [Geminicoccaceae bacterium]